MMKTEIHPKRKKGRRQYENDPEPVVFMPAYFFVKQKLQKKCSCKRDEAQQIVTCKTTPPAIATGG